MTIPTGQAAASAAARAAAPAENPSWPTTTAGRFLVRVIPSLVTLAAGLWGITGSSYWRDEAATLVAVQRSFSQLLRLLGQVDAEHGAYYMMMWVVVRVGGTGELVTRLPSALAMAAAAAAVAAIGYRVVSPQVGLAAGLVFAALPSTSLYAQNARPDAIAVALAAGATYLLVRSLQAGGTSRRWLAGYAACLTALGLMDILGLLLAAPHAVTVAVAASREKDRGDRWALVLRWLLAASVAIVLVSPLIWLTFAERAAIHWIKPPNMGTLRALGDTVAPMPQAHTSYAPFALGILALIAGGLLVSAAGGRARLRRRWPPDIVAICLPWLILPAAILLAVSLVKPVYNVRYILFCVPALALLTGTALAAFGRVAGPAALVVITLLGLPAQWAARQPDGHGENIRLANKIVAANMHPGDAAIFHDPTEESWNFAYPYGFAKLTDIGQAKTPAQSGTLTGTSLPAAVVRQRLSGLSRVWVVDVRYKRQAPQLHIKSFQLVRHWHVDDVWLFLYTRRSGT